MEGRSFLARYAPYCGATPSQALRLFHKPSLYHVAGGTSRGVIPEIPMPAPFLFRDREIHIHYPEVVFVFEA